MTKANTITIYLSQSTIDLINPIPTLSTAIAQQLKAIATELTPNIVVANNPNVLDHKVTLIVDADTHGLLLRATSSNPSLTLSAAVDGLLEAALKPIFSIISDDDLIMEKIEAKPLVYGCLVPQKKKSGIYWLWRYLDRRGKLKDMYLGKGLDQALAKVRAIEIPPDARQQRLNKGKKLWAVNCN